MKEIVFAGSGGQGVLTAGLIISDIAATEGINVTWLRHARRHCQLHGEIL